MSCRRARSACRIGFIGRVAGWCGSLSGWSSPAGIAVGVDRAFFAGQETRSEFMQGVLDRVVTGPDRLAPGVTAYVSGPHGTWVGSAGVADVKTGEPMPLDARMRIESSSKTWLWGGPPTRPGGQAEPRRHASTGGCLVCSERTGARSRFAELMSDSSGLIDDNDISPRRAQLRAYLARVRDPKLRAQLVAVAARIRANPAAQVSPLWFIRLAAWQPLVAPARHRLTTTPTSAGTSPA